MIYSGRVLCQCWRTDRHYKLIIVGESYDLQTYRRAPCHFSLLKGSCGGENCFCEYFKFLHYKYQVIRVSDSLHGIVYIVIYCIHCVHFRLHKAGVAEPGGGPGQGGMPPPPKNLSGWAKVCFAPPPPPRQNFDHWPNGQPMVKIFAKLTLSTLKCAKFSKFSPAASKYG